MSNPYVEYYANQAGNGIPGFAGTRFQRGHGFLGRIFSGILPVLKYLGRKALTTGVNVAQDALQGDNFRDSLKTSLKRKAADNVGDISEDFAMREKKYAQTGTGYRRKRARQTRARNNALSIIQLHTTAERKIRRKPRKQLHKKKVKKHNKRSKTTLF